MKFKATLKDVGSLSFDGEEFEPDGDGVIEIGGKLSAREIADIEAHGFKRIGDEDGQSRKVAKPKRTASRSQAAAAPAQQ